MSQKITTSIGPKIDYPRHTPLHELVAQQAGKSGGRIALIAGGQQFTYQSVNETANQLSHYLSQQGVKRGDIVGVALDRSAEMILMLLAIMKTGAAYLPIDPTFPQQRIEFMLKDSGAQFLVRSKVYPADFGSQTIQLYLEDALLASALLDKGPLECTTSGNDLVYMLYTSGSTGQPKGVQVEHRNLVNLLWSMQIMLGVKKEDRLLASTTVSFDIAALELFLPLLVGATLVIADAVTTRDGSSLLSLLQEHHITIIQATPITYRMLLAAGWYQRLPLKILCCGEPLPESLARQLVDRCDSLWNLYGPTETTIYSTGKQILPTDQLITIGRPIHNTQVYLLDEQLQPVAENEPGEICIAGDGVTRGYYNRAELTQEKFLPNPFSTAGLLYRTGDLGQFTADGDIQFLGRIDQQIKIRGYRIEPGEIEHVLISQIGIREAVVIAKEDRSGTLRLMAYLVLATPLSDLEFAQMHPKWKAALKHVLPSYMVPATFHQVEKIPSTLNGKVDRKRLATGSMLDGSEISLEPLSQESIPTAQLFPFSWRNIFSRLKPSKKRNEDR